MTEPAGTTPLPLSSAGSPVRIWFDDETVADSAQEPQAAVVTGFSAKRHDLHINGSLVSTNRNFVVYVVKNSLLRILHKVSGEKELMRGHENQVITDVQFFNQDDVLASVGGPVSSGNSSLIVSRISVQVSGLISVEMLLEFRTDKFCMRGLVWHPFDMNVRSLLRIGFVCASGADSFALASSQN
jgi:hypothetical protein